MQYSSDEISIDEVVEPSSTINESTKNNSLKYLPRWPPVNIEFQDLSYSVPDLSGKFKNFSIFPSLTRNLNLICSVNVDKGPLYIYLKEKCFNLPVILRVSL